MRTDEADWRAPCGDLTAPMPTEEAVATATLAAEVRALRARLRDVEVALGSPAADGHRAPPALPELARRLAVLERRAGVVPGLVPLPGLGAANAPGAAGPLPAPQARQRWWRACGQAALATLLLVALVAWLLRPPPYDGRAARPTPSAATVVARPTTAPRAVPAAPARAVEAGRAVFPGDTPCLNDGSVLCGVAIQPSPAGAPVPPGVWGRDEACDGLAARACGDASGAPVPARVP